MTGIPESDSSAINAAIKQISEWFSSVYPMKSGFPAYLIDGDSGRPMGDRDLLPELDDYLPFFWMAGDTRYVLDQIERLRDRLASTPLLFHRPQIRQHAGIGLPGIFRRIVPYIDVQDYVEILFGLLELDGLERHDDWIDMAMTLFRSIETSFSRKGRLHSFRLMPFGPVLPVMDAMTGMMVEIGVELFERTREHRFLSAASDWCRSLLDSDLFIRHGVFPSACFSGRWKHVRALERFTHRVELAKANTSMAFGLMALGRIDETSVWALPALDRWVKGIHTLFGTPDGVFTHFPKLPGAPDRLPILSTNFALIDIFCDISVSLDRPELLQSACGIADFFLSHQSDQTGLFPDEIGVERSYLDANTDLAVSLYRLSELTTRTAYAAAGRRSLEGILKHHVAPFGYYRDVHMHSGRPLGSLVETRFVSLLLKALLLYRDRPVLYSSHQDWARFRDR